MTQFFENKDQNPIIRTIFFILVQCVNTANGNRRSEQENGIDFGIWIFLQVYY